MVDGAGDSETDGDGPVEWIALDRDASGESSSSTAAWALSESRVASAARLAGGFFGDLAGVATADSVQQFIGGGTDLADLAGSLGGRWGLFDCGLCGGDPVWGVLWGSLSLRTEGGQGVVELDQPLLGVVGRLSFGGFFPYVFRLGHNQPKCIFNSSNCHGRIYS